MAQSVTQRGVLKKFGVGLAGMAVACFGLANEAEARLPTIKRSAIAVSGSAWPPTLEHSRCLH